MVMLRSRVRLPLVAFIKSSAFMPIWHELSLFTDLNLAKMRGLLSYVVLTFMVILTIALLIVAILDLRK